MNKILQWSLPPIPKPYTWKDIPGWFDFNDIYQQAVDEAPSTGAHFVEIGCLCGRSATFMAEAIKRSQKTIRFDVVDPLIWFDVSSLKKQIKDLQDKGFGIVNDEIMELRDLRAIFLHYASKSCLLEIANIFFAKGQDRTSSYKPNSLDFVFIDTDHSYHDTIELLEGYLPKIKSNGILAGHDYLNISCPGVTQAVNKIFQSDFSINRSSFVHRKK